MFVVTVAFQATESHQEAFRTAVVKQAENSLALEPGCKRFDVCFDPKNPARVFLYELYTTEADFQDHLRSEHFLTFDKLVKPWTRDKQVSTWVLAD